MITYNSDDGEILKLKDVSKLGVELKHDDWQPYQIILRTKNGLIQNDDPIKKHDKFNCQPDEMATVTSTATTTNSPIMYNFADDNCITETFSSYLDRI